MQLKKTIKANFEIYSKSGLSSSLQDNDSLNSNIGIFKWYYKNAANQSSTFYWQYQSIFREYQFYKIAQCLWPNIQQKPMNICWQNTNEKAGKSSCVWDPLRMTRGLDLVTDRWLEAGMIPSSGIPEDPYSSPAASYLPDSTLIPEFNI